MSKFVGAASSTGLGTTTTAGRNAGVGTAVTTLFNIILITFLKP